MRRVGLSAVVLLVVGCVSVEHTKVGPRAYFIEADGQHAGEEDALEGVHERARELCPAGYGIVQTSSSQARRYRGNHTWHKESHAALTVECAPTPVVCATPSCAQATAR